MLLIAVLYIVFICVMAYFDKKKNDFHKSYLCKIESIYEKYCKQTYDFVCETFDTLDISVYQRELINIEIYIFMIISTVKCIKFENNEFKKEVFVGLFDKLGSIGYIKNIDKDFCKERFKQYEKIYIDNYTPSGVFMNCLENISEYNLEQKRYILLGDFITYVIEKGKLAKELVELVELYTNDNSENLNKVFYLINYTIEIDEKYINNIINARYYK